MGPGDAAARVRFRSAGPADAEHIAALHATSWRETYRGMMPDRFLDGDVLSDRRRVWGDRLSRPRPDRLVRVAEDDSGIVGFVCAFADEDPAWGSCIDNLHVRSDAKRAGIGAALMHEAARWLDERWPDRGVYLWVLEANAAARRFYERLGASHAGTAARRDPGGGSAPNCRYVWPNARAIRPAAVGGAPSAVASALNRVGYDRRR